MISFGLVQFDFLSLTTSPSFKTVLPVGLQCQCYTLRRRKAGSCIRDEPETMRIWLPICASFLLLGVKPAASADLSSHRLTVVRGWEVWVDRAQNNSCFIMRMYQRNAVFRVGFGGDASSGYVFLANDAWKSLVAGSKYEIEIQFDDQPPWKGNATAKKTGNVTFLYMEFAGQGLINDLSHSDNALIRYKDEPIAKIQLAGADAAVEELMKCQGSSGRASAPSASHSADPFAQRPNAPDNDPFAPR